MEQPQAAKLKVQITIPKDLRRFLLDDADFVNRQKQLVPLPKPMEKTVKQILNEFTESSIKTTDPLRRSVAEEIIKGIGEYFDVVLGTQLLYKFERPQYSDILKECSGKPMSEIYGPEHLLRLFVKMGSMLSQANIDDQSLHFIVSIIQEFLEWMTKGAEEMFAAVYDTATPEYYRRTAT